VESRGKAIRLEHLTPIPRGDSLESISRQLLGELDAAFAARHAVSRPSSELWAEERVQLLPVPATNFEVRKPSRSRSARVSLSIVESRRYWA